MKAIFKQEALDEFEELKKEMEAIQLIIDEGWWLCIKILGECDEYSLEWFENWEELKQYFLKAI